MLAGAVQFPKGGMAKAAAVTAQTPTAAVGPSKAFVILLMTSLAQAQKIGAGVETTLQMCDGDLPMIL
jgi:hypothetical protein